jgi:hypothetical protein
MTSDRRQRHAHRLLPILFAGLLMLTFLGVHLVRHAIDRGDTVAAQLAPHDPFSISGTTDELFSPGTTAGLDLEFSNALGTSIWITDIRVSLGNVVAPNASDTYPCTTDDFVVEQGVEGLGITVGAGETSPLSRLGVPRSDWPRVGMLDRTMNQDGCQGSTVQLVYTATGVSTA